MPMLIDTAELAGIAAEGGLYGIFVCLFFVCGYDLIRRRARTGSQLSWPMVVAGVLLIFLATARFSVDTANVFVAFIAHDPRDARLAYLSDVTQRLFITKHSILIAVLLVGDSFVNYRCWIVWGKCIYVVLLPIGLSITSAAFGSYTMWAYSNLPDQTVLSEAKWLKVFFSLSLVANALATSMLAYRIWSVDREMKKLNIETELEPGRSSLSPILRIILESGLINAAYLFAYVMTLAFGSQGLEIMSEMATPLTGIIFSIVILRVGHRQHDDMYYTQKAVNTTWVVRRNVTTSTTGTVTAIAGSSKLDIGGGEDDVELGPFTTSNVP
ncbi:hypothetical protein C8Q74DRAFT_1204758 [Fomes fomentarius]|nr:hypothetical protein C8Q74DRAFT_1204758 [Fomes fomentarius]